LSDLTLEHVPETDVWLIHVFHAHHLMPSGAVLGRLKNDEVEDSRKLGHRITDLCVERHNQSDPLFGQGPTHVNRAPGSPLSSFVLFEAIHHGTQWPSDQRLQHETRMIREHWQKPFDRVFADMRTTLVQPGAPAGTSGDSDRPLHTDTLSEWFRWASHPEHVDAELGAIALGWRGASRFM
jgi:hypothetical protein